MMECIESHRMFNGWHKRYQHRSETLNCVMHVSVYLPDVIEIEKLPCVYWLSGLTCSDENFSVKAGAQKKAAELGIVLVIPDTSPRGDEVADDDHYDLGQGAGFYLNATQTPWKKHYRMYDYIVDELPGLIESNFNVSGLKSLSGHSMGGHGALVIALKNSTAYQSVSAFSPIVSPSQCPWGIKAFSAYLGDNKNTWKEYDTVELVKGGKYERRIPILIDQGSDDQFLQEQLKTPLLIEACRVNDFPATINFRGKHDHSYFFVSSFIEEHLNFHAEHLKCV